MLRALTVSFLATACSASLLASDYTLLATPSTVAWGYYSGSSKPVLTVHSGDTVRMQTLSTCGPPDRLIARGVKAEDIPPYTGPIYKEVTDKGPGGHILTGPVAIEDAEPGDVLEVQILKDRYRRELCVQRIWPGPRFSADGVSVQPEQDHSARPQSDGRQLRARDRYSTSSVLRQHGRSTGGCANR